MATALSYDPNKLVFVSSLRKYSAIVRLLSSTKFKCINVVFSINQHSIEHITIFVRYNFVEFLLRETEQKHCSAGQGCEAASDEIVSALIPNDFMRIQLISSRILIVSCKSISQKYL